MVDQPDGPSTPLALTKIHTKGAFLRDLQEGRVIFSATCPIFEENLKDTSETT